MTRLSPRAFLTMAISLALAACGGPTPSQPVTITLLPATPAPSGAPTATPQPIATLGEVTGEIELFVTGGPAEGEYRAVVNGTSCILPTEEQLVANYADPFAADGFTALDLDVRDVPAALEDETDDFLLDLTVAGISYTIDPSAGEGEGSALLEIDPLRNATLDLFATAEDGVEIELSLLCEVDALF